jgi:hypothetical protein
VGVRQRFGASHYGAILKWTRLVHLGLGRERKLRRRAAAQSVGAVRFAASIVHTNWCMVDKLCTSDLGKPSRNAKLRVREVALARSFAGRSAELVRSAARTKHGSVLLSCFGCCWIGSDVIFHNLIQAKALLEWRCVLAGRAGFEVAMNRSASVVGAGSRALGG